MYEESITVTVLGGEIPPSVTMRVWSVVDYYNPNGPNSTQSVTPDPQGVGSASLVPAPSLDSDGLPSQTVQISVGAQPSVVTGEGQLALTLHPNDDTTPVDWFRSGLLDTLPSAGIEVVLIDNQVIDAADINTQLTGISISDQVIDVIGITDTVTVTAPPPTVTLSSGSIAVALSGATVSLSGHGPTVGVGYSATFDLLPSGDVVNTGDVLEVGAFTSPGPTFTSSGSVGSDIVTALGNFLSGWLENTFGPTLRDVIQTKVNAAALTATANALNVSSPSALPAGIVLSLSAVEITATGIVVSPALGAIGGVISKFPTPPPPSSGGSLCMLSVLALETTAAIDLVALRAIRDAVARSGPSGRRAVAAYYRHGRELRRILDADPALRARTIALASALPRGGRLRHSATALARDLRAAASPALRRDIDWLLALPFEGWLA
ncbi:MAG: hypothetical protein ABSC56_11145 [Solirubrobacteraceae bacterium]